MRFIPTQIHAIIDYLFGAVLIASPWMLGFANQDAAMWIPIAVGITVIVYSLMTAYELGVVRVIPVPVHLVLDAVGGIFLAASPWIFGFADLVWIPHVVFGLLELVVALVTRTVPVLVTRASSPSADRPARPTAPQASRH